jgi:hypothetical protein
VPREDEGELLMDPNYYKIGRGVYDTTSIFEWDWREKNRKQNSSIRLSVYSRNNMDGHRIDLMIISSSSKVHRMR